MERRAAFEVVDRFEEALCEYTGAPYAVTVDSCTNALFLALKYEKGGVWPNVLTVEIPKHTYIGVYQAATNAGCCIKLTDEEWSGSYAIGNTKIVDSAKRFERDMYQPGTLTCLSFQAGKLLPIGRGGAILLDDARAAKWFRRARLDGRQQGADYQNPTYQQPGFHCYMTPDDAARGLWLMTYIEDHDKGDWTEYPSLRGARWT